MEFGQEKGVLGSIHILKPNLSISSEHTGFLSTNNEAIFNSHLGSSQLARRMDFSSRLTIQMSWLTNIDIEYPLHMAYSLGGSGSGRELTSLVTDSCQASRPTMPGTSLVVCIIPVKLATLVK